MKALICGCLALLLLAGCAPSAPPAEPSSTVVETREPTVTEPLPSTEAPMPWEPKTQRWEEDKRLLRMEYPLMEEPWNGAQLVGDRLLLYQNVYEEGGRNYIELASVDLRCEQVTGRQRTVVSHAMLPQLLGDTVVLADSAQGWILQFSKDLQLIHRWEADPMDEDWIVGECQGAPMLYRFAFEEELTAENLETGEKTKICGQNPRLWPMERSQAEVYTMVTQGRDFLLQPAALSLTTGELNGFPGEKPMASGVRVGDCWLSTGQGDGRYYLTEAGKTVCLRGAEGYVTLLPDGRLLETDHITQRLTLYEPDGTNLGSCQPICREEGWLHQVFPVPELGGYLIPVFRPDERMELALWRPVREEGAVDMVLEPLETARPDGDSRVSPGLKKRAAELSREYGLEIRIADQFDPASLPYTVELLLDETQIEQALDLAEKVLSSYPEGFFRQLRWGNIRGTQLWLSGSIYPGEQRTIEGFSGFVHEQGDNCIVVIDGQYAHDFTYAHEFSHVIDRKLEWDSQCRPDATFSEAQWSSLNPKDFSYTQDYENVASYFEDQAMYGWFLSPYSTVNSTEDRATVMEAAIGIQWAFEQAPGMDQKLRYYSECIREAFDTTGWPEATIWEQVFLNP